MIFKKSEEYFATLWTNVRVFRGSKWGRGGKMVTQ